MVVSVVYIFQSQLWQQLCCTVGFSGFFLAVRRCTPPCCKGCHDLSFSSFQLFAQRLGRLEPPLLKSESQHVSFCIHLPILQRTRNDSDILDDIPPTLILSQAHPKRSENYKLDHVSFKRNLCFLSFPLSLHISPSLYIIHVHIYIYIYVYIPTYIEAHNIYSYYIL